ncbi:MAG: hypothetical protein C7B47_09235 [Sulfobacillus thermosulfidooxidans]|uniref:TadE-like domain-containing protein n=1 Tax=Sulfobacillus thermosulfidooxidans TaxID=28034 RepID=A0A2T2WXY0_SULTH|nr:MAG: hypothetical protein C7B47_09235 [Sulfobacillus thermosulfidooxidans]
MMRWLRKHIKGQATVEFALIFPIFLVLVLEGINLLLMVAARTSVQDAESAVSRWISVGRPKQAGIAAMAAFQEAPGMDAKNVAILITYPAGTVNLSNRVYWNGKNSTPTSANSCSQLNPPDTTHSYSSWGCVHVSYHPSSKGLTLTATATTGVPAMTVNGQTVHTNGIAGFWSLGVWPTSLWELLFGSHIATVQFNNVQISGNPATATITTHYYNYRVIAPTLGIIASHYSFTIPAQTVPVDNLSPVLAGY